METVRADLHNHIRTSNNFADGDFNKAVDMASKRLGEYGILGVVDFEDSRYEKFNELKGYERYFLGDEKRVSYVPEKKIIIVHGQEVPTEEGHLLVLASGMNTKIKSGKCVEDTLKEINDAGAISVVDHPFYVDGLGDYIEYHSDILEKIDAIEVHNGEAAFSIPFLNGPFPRMANEKAQRFYESIQRDFPNLGALASSDGHSIYEIGSSWTELNKPSLESEARFLGDVRISIWKSGNARQKRGNSVIGAIDHVLDLATIIGLSKVPILRRLVASNNENK